MPFTELLLRLAVLAALVFAAWAFIVALGTGTAPAWVLPLAVLLLVLVAAIGLVATPRRQ
jgi:TRAP-type C4-dicarboxylate transport system permease small subunit